MDASRSWFRKNAAQDMNVNMSRLPVLARTGHANGETTNDNLDKQGNKAFVVGKSTVGGKEVVG